MPKKNGLINAVKQHIYGVICEYSWRLVNIHYTIQKFASIW
jgi:hypothetical protein